jgi:hypothetical protein
MFTANSRWEELYMRTILEVDGHKMPERITAIRQAISGRLHDIEHNSDHHAERQQIENALRVWVPSWENRDLRQLLWHRHGMVQMRTRLNQLQAVALNEGLRRGIQNPCGVLPERYDFRIANRLRGGDAAGGR